MILPGYLWTFLACCGVVMWTGIVGGFNITMLPSYASRLGLSTTQIGLLYLDYAGITALSNIYFGKVADRGKRKAAGICRLPGRADCVCPSSHGHEPLRGSGSDGTYRPWSRYRQSGKPAMALIVTRPVRPGEVRSLEYSTLPGCREWLSGR